MAGTVVAIDKPRQWTSFQAVSKVKSTVRTLFGLKKFKIGHAGTLDPMATGLLLVCIGRATKQIPVLQDGEKEYTGTIVLGATTPCYDLEQGIDRAYHYSHVTEESARDARMQFLGDIMQVPPMFSALKVDGRRAYEYARDNDETAEVKPRKVCVSNFEITAFRAGDPDREMQWLGGDLGRVVEAEAAQGMPLYKNPQGYVPEWLPQVDFRVRCSKGTYIRSLARDFGVALGSGAFLAALRRTQIGDYRVEQAVRLEEVASLFSDAVKCS
ncbi:MAG: tRNA pseudouridine(55) synthase TruB [Bacteroidales bacterium]|nr:tRNA pseudouridine(55) synthase TruB [Bacteroidales bacterium]